MSVVRLFVEGKADRNFISQYVKSLDLDEIEIEPLGGRDLSNFIANKEAQFDTALADDMTVLVVLDADDDWESRKELVFNFLRPYVKNNFEQVFLFPDDQSNGCLEDLLLDLIPKEKRAILNCLKSASDCVEQIGFRGMDKKDNVYQYVSSQLTGAQMGNRSKHANESRRSYSDSTVWNLKSEALQPLKAFLKKHLA